MPITPREPVLARIILLAIVALCPMGQKLALGEDVDIVHSQPGVSLRSIVVVDQKVVLAGGSSGALLRSENAGQTWKAVTVSKDSESLDFRDLASTGDGNVVLMSAGPGDQSRIYQSGDRGKTWSERHRNRIPEGFFNGVAFWPNGTGLLIGDPLDSELFLLKSTDFGKTWNRVRGPRMREGEYGFAASGTGIVTVPPSSAIVATGGAAARILESPDHGVTWNPQKTNVRHGNPSSGFFSVAVNAAGSAVAVGGDYKSPREAEMNYAYRLKPQSAWITGKSNLPHKACVRFLNDNVAFCAGRTGIAQSNDGGRTWTAISNQSFYTFDISTDSSKLFLAGADGRIATLRLSAD